jgi:hypothetical protein
VLLLKKNWLPVNLINFFHSLKKWWQPSHKCEALP